MCEGVVCEEEASVTLCPEVTPGVQYEQTDVHVSHLQQHFAAVDAHGIHGAKGHECDGDRRCRVHSIVVTKKKKNNRAHWIKQRVRQDQIIVWPTSRRTKKEIVINFTS